ncbi:MAG: pantetheine-phosphate adenylyltransferase [Clostridia bacterium]|nr:pantetheine-phosphate adenylyltransferase [Clostridia bacterium]
MKIGFYAGSFDPFTNGHLHVVETSAKLFDKVIIAIGVHSYKNRRFSKTKMKQAIEKVLANRNLTNVEVIIYEGFTSDVALECKATYLIRGLRNGMDYQYEENISTINEVTSKMDTIYIRAGEYGSISSSMVMELLEYNKDISNYVPKEILELLLEEMKKSKE